MKIEVPISTTTGLLTSGPTCIAAVVASRFVGGFYGAGVCLHESNSVRIALFDRFQDMLLSIEQSMDLDSCHFSQ